MRGLGNPVLIDGERLLDLFWPEAVPDRFEELAIPFTAVAADYHRHAEVVLADGPLTPAVAASLAIPGLVRPVALGGRVLIDGGAIDPLPYRELLAPGRIVFAVDVSAPTTATSDTRIPGAMEAIVGASQILAGGNRARIGVQMRRWLHAGVQPGERVGDLPVRRMRGTQRAHLTTPGRVFAVSAMVSFLALLAPVASFFATEGAAGVVGGAVSSDTTICLTGMSGGTFSVRSVSPTIDENTGPDTWPPKWLPAVGSSTETATTMRGFGIGAIPTNDARYFDLSYPWAPCLYAVPLLPPTR